jgi:hypothetical protein
LQGRDRFAGKKIWIGFAEAKHALGMKGQQLRERGSVISAEFRAVGKRSAVRTDRSGYEGTLLARINVEKAGAGALGNANTQGQRICRIFAGDTNFFESFKGNLIAAGGDATRAGFQIIEVNLFDGLGIVEQNAGGPRGNRLRPNREGQAKSAIGTEKSHFFGDATSRVPPDGAEQLSSNRSTRERREWIEETEESGKDSAQVVEKRD